MRMNDDERIVVHLDVDAFYVACERELRPELQNRPLAVSQYNPYGDLRDIGISDPSRILYDGGGDLNNNVHHKKPSNPNANGSLIAVSYEARARNVRRNDRGLEAVKKCPELCIVQVPVQNGKASLTIYRDASYRVMTALAESMKTAAMKLYQDLLLRENEDNINNREKLNKKMVLIKVEKASVDEIYIDLSVPVQTILHICQEERGEVLQRLYSALTSEQSAASHTTIGGLETSQAAIATNSLSKNDIRKGSCLQVLDTNDADSPEDATRKAWWSRTFPEEWSQTEIALAVGSLITLRGRQGVIDKFNGVYTLSAGVSSNKTLAKLASGLKKPNRQTLINPRDEAALQKLFHPLPLGRIRGLGGQFGDEVQEALQVKTVGELAKIPLMSLREKFGDKQGHFLYRIAQGICDEPVTERTKAKSIGAGKTFQGALSIRSTDHSKLRKWIGNLLGEIMERVDDDKTRYPQTLVIGLNMKVTEEKNGSRRHVSQSTPLPRNSTMEKRLDMAVQLAKDILANTNACSTTGESATIMVIGMSVSATNFVPIATGSNSIIGAFRRCSSNVTNHGPSTVIRTESQKRAPSLVSRHMRSMKRPKAGTIENFLIHSNAQSTRSLKGTVLQPFPDNAYTHGGLSSDLDKQMKNSQERKQLLEPPSSLQQRNPHALAPGRASKNTDLDLEFAKLLQAQLNEEGCRGGIISRSSHPSQVDEEKHDAFEVQKSCSMHDHDATKASGDPDLEFAKQLQASFDREDEVLSNVDRKLPKAQASSQQSKNRKLQRFSSSLQPSKVAGDHSKGSISKFFVKK